MNRISGKLWQGGKRKTVLFFFQKHKPDMQHEETATNEGVEKKHGIIPVLIVVSYFAHMGRFDLTDTQKHTKNSTQCGMELTLNREASWYSLKSVSPHFVSLSG